MAVLSTRAGYHTLIWTDPQTKKRKRLSLGKIGTIPKQQLRHILEQKEYELSTGARLLNAHRRPCPPFGVFVRNTYLPWHALEYPDSHFRVEQILVDHLLPEFELKPMNLLTVGEVEAYKNKRRFRVRGSTVEKELRTLNAVLNRAVDLKVMSDNPVSLVKPPRKLDSKPHHYYTLAQLETLYRQSDYGPIWRFMANTGLRRGESLHLRREWITDAVRIQSTGEDRTKSGQWRKVPLTDGARAALKEIPDDGIYLLPHMASESLSRAFSRDAKRARLAGSLHSLRHTYICHLLLAGVPIRTVQLYAGHASIATTEKYAYQVLPNDPEVVKRLAI